MIHMLVDSFVMNHISEDQGASLSSSSCNEPLVVDMTVSPSQRLNINLRGSLGRTALHWAFEKQHLEIAKELVELYEDGIDVSITDDVSHTMFITMECCYNPPLSFRLIRMI